MAFFISKKNLCCIWPYLVAFHAGGVDPIESSDHRKKQSQSKINLWSPAEKSMLVAIINATKKKLKQHF